MKTKFKVKWSKDVKAITTIVVLVLIAVEVASCYWLYNSYNVVLLGTSIFIIFVLVFLLGFMPLSVEIDGKFLILNRMVGKIIIPATEIEEIAPYHHQSKELRIFGSGGVFGYLGCFKNREFGTYNSYVGDYKQAFYVLTKSGKKYLFSCQGRETLVQQVKKLIAAQC